MDRARTLEEIKDDIRSRIGHRAPFVLADRSESEEALASLHGVEPEPWAAAWSRLGARWEDKAHAEEKSGDPGKTDRKSTRLNSSHIQKSRMPSSA